MSGSKLWREGDWDCSASILVIRSRAAARLRSCDEDDCHDGGKVVLPPHGVSMKGKSVLGSSGRNRSTSLIV